MENTPVCIDREYERKEILKQILKAEKAMVHFIYAPTAIGKSTLTQKLTLEAARKNFMVPICVRTAPQNDSNKYNEWEVFELIFETIDSFAKTNKTIVSFSEYTHNDSTLKDQSLDGLILGSVDLVIKPREGLGNIIKNRLENLFHIGSQRASNIKLDYSPRSRMIRKSYIKYIFNNYRILLVVDNFQNIDYSSFKHIIDIIRVTRNRKNYYIFEYTITENSKTDDLFRSINFIKNCGLPVGTTLLKKIPNEYIVDVVNHNCPNKPTSFEFNIELIKFYDEISKGNLKQVIEYVANYSINKDRIIEDQTLLSILSISDKAKYILCLIIHHKGVLKTSKFHILESYFSDKYKYDNLFEELISHRLIKKDITEELRLDHASIGDSWKNSNIPELKSIDSIVCSVLENHYYTLIENKCFNNDELPWLGLLEIYKNTYPEKISEMLNFLRQGVLKEISPETSWEFLNAFIQTTKDQLTVFENVYFDILKICFEFELYSEGYSCIEIMEKNYSLWQKPKILFHKMMYLSALDKHIENIELYSQYKAYFQEGSRERLILMLIAQASYRARNEIAECLHIFSMINKNSSYKEFDEYGYFLRLTDMYMTNKKSIKYIEKSYNFFIKRNLLHQAGKSAIACAHVVSSSGSIKKGLWYIEQAENLLSDKTMGSHMFMLNKAVINLHMKNPTYAVWNYLQLAETTARVPFDKLAVQIGKLVWCLQNGKLDECQDIIDTILPLTEKEPDKHIVALAYYDIYLYFNYICEKSKSLHYKNLAYSLREWCPQIAHRIERTKCRDKKFILKNPWCLCYLEYWTFDILY